MYAVFPAAIRLSCGIAIAIVALIVRDRPVDVPLLAVVVTGLTVWAVVFYRRSVRSGVSVRLAVVDLALTTVCCLLMPRLVAPDVLPGGVSWIAVLASTSVIVCQFALPTWAGVLAGVTVTIAYAVGAGWVGDPKEATDHATILLLQTIFASGLVYLTMRSSRTADQAFATYQRTAQEAVIARAAREAERRQNRDLHDTVLSTLTIVGLGAVGSSSRALRARAAVDLHTLTDPARTAIVDPTVRVSLDGRLQQVLDAAPMAVIESLEPCLVPLIAAEAIADSAAAALSNVARHAPGAAVWLRLHRAGATVVVEVIDAGPGFDPARVPPYRYGLRESVVGRMASVGGVAVVDSAPGRGTRIRLAWTDDEWIGHRRPDYDRPERDRLDRAGPDRPDRDRTDYDRPDRDRLDRAGLDSDRADERRPDRLDRAGPDWPDERRTDHARPDSDRPEPDRPDEAVR